MLSQKLTTVFIAITTLFVILSAYASDPLEHDDVEDNDHPFSKRKALIQGRYRAGEAVSKTMYFEPGKRLRVRWKAKPAKGNCVISLFSLFNADLLFSGLPDDQKPAWSEIAFETFGGSVGTTEKQFQTQYISQDDPNASPTTRGDQHVVNHVTGGRIPDIFDGSFHVFDIDWRPAGDGLDSEITYRIDYKQIRKVIGGDANYLEPPLDIYAGVWASHRRNEWACTSDNNRPNTALASVQFVQVFEQVGTSWQLRKDYRFEDQNSINEDWNLSDWGFGGFDGAFDRSAVRVSGKRMRLDLQRNY